MSCSVGLLWLVVISGGLMLFRLSRQVRAHRDRLAEAELELLRLGQLIEEQPAPEVIVPPLPAAATPARQEAAKWKAPSLPEVPSQEPPPVAAPEPAATAASDTPPAVADEPPVTAPPPPRKPPIEVDWERWVGVRGAAVLGGVVLALAMILFLKYSIEHGLIPPIVRVALGFLAGGGSLVASESLRRRAYGVTADAVAGAGVVMLYAAVWAGRVLYALIPGPLAWVLMVLVTVVCGLLSWRRESLVIALLGLTGGFLTPLLLQTGRVDPIGLFSYVLLLDVGLLWLAARRRWPILSVLSLGATFFYQAFWILGEMSATQLPLTLGIVGVFALLFALFGGRGGQAETATSGGFERWSKAAGVLLPFLFALSFAARADLGRHLAPIAALIALLSVAAVWLGRVHRVGWLPIAVAAADVAVVWVWVARTHLDPALAWELVGVAVVLAMAFHWPLELDRRRRAPAADAWLAPTVAAGGLTVLVIFAGFGAGGTALFWPWLLGWLGLTALSIRQAELTGEVRVRIGSATVPALAFTSYTALHGSSVAMPSAALYLGLMVLVAAGFHFLALLVREAETEALGQARDVAAALAPVLLAAGLVVTADFGGFAALHFVGATLALGVLAVLAATRLASGAFYIIAMFVVAMAQMFWVFEGHDLGRQDGAELTAFVGQVVTVLVFTFWPFIAGRRLASDRWTLYGAALAGPVWFLPLRELYERLFGSDWIAVLPLALGAASLGAALSARRLWDGADPAHKRSLVWFLAVAMGFVSVAIPLQLDKQWITLGWALQGLAVMALWKRLDHPGLRYFGLALLAAVTLRLVANPALLGYYTRSGWPVLNWLMYTYLVPAGALLWSARIQESLEVERREPREARLNAGDLPLGAAACAVAAIVVVFVWINLTIFDAFSRGPELSVSLERLPARDLTLSLAWILYAVVLLAIGMARRSVPLRWISLAFLILAIAKVFLYDLGELRELYRVASLVGLAMSLLFVSLAYQRFVFRLAPEEPEGE